MLKVLLIAATLLLCASGCGGKVANEGGRQAQPDSGSSAGPTDTPGSTYEATSAFGTSAADPYVVIRRDGARDRLVFVRLRAVSSGDWSGGGKFSTPPGWVLDAALRCKGASSQLRTLAPSECEQARSVAGSVGVSTTTLSAHVTLAFDAPRLGDAADSINVDNARLVFGE